MSVARMDRPGEGAVLEVVRNESVGVSGVTAISLNVDLTTAPVPDRRYVADVASLIRSGDQNHLVFGQSKIVGKGLRSLIAINLSAAAVRNFVLTLSSFMETGRKYVADNKLSKSGFVDGIEEEPTQTVAMVSNLIAASFSGREACADFYYASPFAFQKVKAGGNFAADPVVRVSLPTGLLFAICEKLISISAELPADVA